MTEFIPLTWQDTLYLAPELILAAMFLILIVTDLILPGRTNRAVIGWLSLAGLLLSLAAVIWRMMDMNPSGVSAAEAAEAGKAISLLGASYRVDDYGNLLKIIFLIGTSLVVLLGLGSTQRDDAVTDKAEFYYLLLPEAAGAMIMASSGNLVTLYIGLELLSITTYVLVGLRKRSSLSAEAAFKYVVTGGIASAFVLFGMSYLYGVTGSVSLANFPTALPQAFTDYKALVYVGFFFLIAGFGIKIAAAPFHVWAADVYQGAPTPVSAFLAVIAKGAALAAVFRFLYSSAFFLSGGAGKQAGDDVFFALLVIAAAAMIAGTVSALRQKQVKRLLALSGVANAGYLLVPIAISVTIIHSNNFSEFVFYLVAYLLMNVGAFAVVTVIARAAGHEELKGFSGLYYRAPWTAAAMLIFILSLSGLPVTAGFFGKLFILLGAASVKAYWLVAIMAVSTVISYYFYFGIIRQMFMRSNGEEEDVIHVPAVTGIVIWICAAATVALGILPGPLMKWIDTVFTIQADLFVR